MASKEERYQKFIDDCEDAGFDVNPEYHGRYYYVGPAVECKDWNELVEVIRATNNKLQWDNLGLGFIVYPE